MKTRLAALAALITLSVAACNAPAPDQTAPAATAPPAAAVESPPAQAAPEAAPAAPKLQADMRSLWHGHIEKTRDYALAVKDGDTAGATAAADGVVSNAHAISDAVAGFYGPEAGTKMMDLLAGHWGAVKAMTDAGQKGDSAGMQKALDDGIANAGAIATFLAGANPNLPEDTVNALMVSHVNDHHTQIGQIMAGDTTAEATTWAAMQEHMDMISDALAAAIAKQFPDKAS